MHCISVLTLLSWLLLLTLAQSAQKTTFSGPAQRTRSKTGRIDPPKASGQCDTKAHYHRPSYSDMDTRTKDFLSDPWRSAIHSRLPTPLKTRQDDMRVTDIALRVVGINAGNAYLAYREKYQDSIKHVSNLVFKNFDRWEPLIAKGMLNDGNRVKELRPLLSALHQTVENRDIAKRNRLTNEALAKVVSGVKAVRYQWNAKQRIRERTGKKSGKRKGRSRRRR